MNCSEVENNLVLYVYGELDATDAALLEKHLDGCNTCGESLEEYRAVLESSRNVETKTADDVGIERINRAVRAELLSERGVTRGNVLHFILRYAAAAAIVVALIIFARSPRDGTNPRQTASSDTASGSKTTFASLTSTSSSLTGRTTADIMAAGQPEIQKPKYKFPEQVRDADRFQRIDGGLILARAYISRSGKISADERLTRLEGRVAAERSKLKSILASEKVSRY